MDEQIPERTSIGVVAREKFLHQKKKTEHTRRNLNRSFLYINFYNRHLPCRIKSYQNKFHKGGFISNK